jgi:hypothetical protein
MRWLKHVVSLGLLVAAAAIALATGFSDHSADYGQVPLPPGGTVRLPEGRVIVYFNQPGNSSDPIQQVNVPIAFQVTSTTGVAVPVTTDNGSQSASTDSVQRSEQIGELGSVAKLQVPTSGYYMVSGNVGAGISDASLKFGTNAGQALLQRWRLFAFLIGGAFLIALIPVPKHKRHWEDEAGPPTGWSSDPRAPYAG